MLKIGVYGASGRVGRLLLEEINNNNEFFGVIFARRELDFVLPQNSAATSDLNDFINQSEVIIDFSTASATKILLEKLESNSKPCVIGTTGLDNDDFEKIKKVALTSPILHATNMSIGMALLNSIVERVARELKTADIEISEIHHRFKVDAPSGSALTLAESCAKGRELDLNKVMVTDRKNAGKRESSDISVVSLRGGDVVGRHCVGFYMDGEFLEFTHNATSRATFSKGAITCAKWIVDKKPGVYKISDVFA